MKYIRFFHLASKVFSLLDYKYSKLCIFLREMGWTVWPIFPICTSGCILASKLTTTQSANKIGKILVNPDTPDIFVTRWRLILCTSCNWDHACKGLTELGQNQLVWIIWITNMTTDSLGKDQFTKKPNYCSAEINRVIPHVLTAGNLWWSSPTYKYEHPVPFDYNLELTCAKISISAGQQK
mgnify:CR=1 FL=1